MGLKGSENGCQAVFQFLFPKSFLACPRLSETRELVDVDRSETLAVLDGNVMVMAVPQTMTTFNEYVMIMVAQITPAIEAAAHVVVVFDEPKAMTRAKAAEQQARDARRKTKTPVCSNELVACITTDEFTQDMLQADGCNVRLLMDHRAARSRFFDALCVAVLAHFSETNGEGTWSLTFDGIDARGAGRDFEERRVAGILSSDQDFWSALLARESAIGEGDIKLTDVAQRVHDAALVSGTPVDGVVLNLLVTVDTDSLVIELMKQAQRLQRKDEKDKNELTVLCLKEPARKRKGDDFVTPSRFLCCNIAKFYEDMCEYMDTSSSADNSSAVALMVGALATCGCDFLEVKGARADLMMPVVKDVIQKNPQILKVMGNIFKQKEDEIQLAKGAIETVLQSYANEISTKPRMARASASVNDYCEAQLLRTVWITAYWSGREFKDCYNWGFPSASCA